ncbi:hypothetical protein JW930_01940 [Candidatus Woesearchaeota archaeon]|nr:hypothetical protein [Candidatus Woesearchaeota archaeon]
MVLKKLTLILISSLFGLTLCVAIAGFSAQVLLYPDIYETALEENDVYDYIEERIALQGYIPEPIFAETGIKATLNKLIRRSLAYVRAEEEVLDLTIEFNDTILTFFEKRIMELDTCKPNQMPFAEDDIVCRPADLSAEEFNEIVLEQQDIDIAQISSVNLGEALGIEKMLSPVREGVRIFRIALIAAVALSFFFLMLIIILNRKSISSIAKWVDTELFIVSLSMLTSSYLIKRYLPDNIPVDIDILKAFLMQIIFTILDIMAYYAAIIIVVAIVMMIVATVFKKKK